MADVHGMVTIPLQDDELISLLRDEPLEVVVQSLKGADPTFRVREDGPLVDAGGLRLGRKSWARALQLLSLDGQPREFLRVAGAIRDAAAERGWT